MVHLVKTAAEFKELIVSNRVVIIDYFAEWCGPCKVISPKFEQFEQKYTKAKFIKVDVDQLGEVSAQQGIRAMPTFQIYLDGVKATEIVGADAKKLEEAINTYNSKV